MMKRAVRRFGQFIFAGLISCLILPSQMTVTGSITGNVMDATPHPGFCVIILGMPTAVVKMEPKSEGIATPRKKRPKEIAVITECCTGCAGSPACVPYCPVADCMYWVPDEDHQPFGHIEVDAMLCIGCKKCVSKGPDGAFLDGCPWDAIEMVAIEQVEAMIGMKMPV